MKASPSPDLSAAVRIPVTRIVRELMKSAVPGWYGKVELRLVLTEESLAGVIFKTERQRTMRSTDQAEDVKAAQKNTPRELAVKNLSDGIGDRLLLRLETVKIIGHFADGFLNKCDIVDEASTAATQS